MYKKQAIEKLFDIIYALRDQARPWKKMSETSKWMNTDEEIPFHVAKAHFEHLINTDINFKSSVTQWAESVGIELVDCVTAIKPIEKSNKSRKFLISNSITSPYKNNSIPDIVFKTLAEAENPLRANDIVPIVQAAGKRSKYKNIIEALYKLEKNKNAKKIKKGNIVFWSIRSRTTRAQKSSVIKGNHPRIIQKYQAQDYTKVRNCILKELANKPLQVSELQKKLEQSGVIDKDAEYSYKQRYKQLWWQLRTLQDKGKISSSKAEIQGQSRVLWKSTT